jgi:hypothetical protein
MKMTSPVADVESTIRRSGQHRNPDLRDCAAQGTACTRPWQRFVPALTGDTTWLPVTLA